MVHWAWLILAAIVGAGITVLFMSCWVINKLDKEEERTLAEYINRENSLK